MRTNEGKTDQVSFRIKPEDKRRLELYCARYDISLSQLVRRLIKKYMEENK